MRIPLPLSSPLAQRYGGAIENACNAIADHGYLHRPVTMILALLWERLRRTMQRLDRLVLRWQAGERLVPRPRRPRPPRVPQPPDPNRRPGRFDGVKLPRAKAWLLRIVQPAAIAMPAIQRMLEDPEVIALCAAAPQAGRLIRPLCHMYGIPLPAWLQLPPRPRKPKPAKPRPPPKFMHPDDRPVAARYFTPAQRSRLRRLGYVFKTEP